MSAADDVHWQNISYFLFSAGFFVVGQCVERLNIIVKSRKAFYWSVLIFSAALIIRMTANPSYFHSKAVKSPLPAILWAATISPIYGICSTYLCITRLSIVMPGKNWEYYLNLVLHVCAAFTTTAVGFFYAFAMNDYARLSDLAPILVTDAILILISGVISGVSIYRHFSRFASIDSKTRVKIAITYLIYVFLYSLVFVLNIVAFYLKVTILGSALYQLGNALCLYSILVFLDNTKDALINKNSNLSYPETQLLATTKMDSPHNSEQILRSTRQ